MKTRHIIFFLLLCISCSGFSQVLKPVKWSFSSSKVNDSTANLYMKATIDKGWHIYSQFITGEGPIPTTFTFDKSNDYIFVGKAYEPKAIEEYDKNFEMKLKYFENSVTFIQQIKIV